MRLLNKSGKKDQLMQGVFPEKQYKKKEEKTKSLDKNNNKEGGERGRGDFHSTLGGLRLGKASKPIPKADDCLFIKRRPC